jgi:hypothetical protein
VVHPRSLRLQSQNRRPKESEEVSAFGLPCSQLNAYQYLEGRKVIEDSDDDEVVE